jgi:hypothetical protein
MATPSNDLNINQAGYVTFDGTATFFGRTFQAGTGITLTNPDGIAGNTTITATGVGTVIELTGNSGTATPDGSGNINVVTANSTPKFVGASHTLTLDFNLTNLALGSSMSSVTSAANNVGMGAGTLNALVSGVQNCAFGTSSLLTGTSYNYCSAFGYQALANNNGDFNSAFGRDALFNLATGTDNTALGFFAGQGILGSHNTLIGSAALSNGSGSDNIAIGFSASSNYTTTESSNIIIGNTGTAADANTTRIGTQGSGSGQQNKCFVAGITGVTTSNSQMVTINTSTGQLGAAAIPASIIWSEVSGSFSSVAGHGYFVTNTASTTLPASPTEGDTIRYSVDTTNILTINANTGQTIRLNTSVTASAGNAVNVAQGAAIELVYKSTGTVWMAVSANGNWTLT